MPTEHEEAVLAAATLSAASLVTDEEKAKLLAAFDTYRSMVAVLLDEQGSDSALLYLRGTARIGLEVEPPDEMARTMHRRVMFVLALSGVEPLTLEEIDAEMRAAAQSLIYQTEAATRPD